MRILDSVFGAHAERLQTALGLTAERQRVLAGNLANVNTPGFKRRDVDFAISLKEAGANRVGVQRMHPAHRAGGAMLSRRDPQVQVENRSIRSDGNSVDLEREVAALTETQLHFGALSLMSRRYFQGLKDVIREGR